MCCFHLKMVLAAGICDVEMEAEESDAEDDVPEPAREAARKIPNKAHDEAKNVANPILSKWVIQDGGQESANPDLGKNEPCSELQDVIKRAQTRRVRWADEEEEVDGFHIQGGGKKVSESLPGNAIHTCEGLRYLLFLQGHLWKRLRHCHLV